MNHEPHDAVPRGRSVDSVHCWPLLVLGCGGTEPGTLELRIYGEDFIEQGIPATAFHDGWSVEVRSTSCVSVAEVERGPGPWRAAALTTTGPRMFDLAGPTMGQGTVVASGMVNGGTYDHVNYTIAPATGGHHGRPRVSTPALVAAMVSAGRVGAGEGDCQQGGHARSASTGASRTRSSTSATPRLEVDGGTARAELTIHGDHLFYDDLVAAEPDLAFELIAAADANADNQITPARAGRQGHQQGQARYQVGSFKVTNLCGSSSAIRRPRWVTSTARATARRKRNRRPGRPPLTIDDPGLLSSQGVRHGAHAGNPRRVRSAPARRRTNMHGLVSWWHAQRAGRCSWLRPRTGALCQPSRLRARRRSAG